MKTREYDRDSWIVRLCWKMNSEAPYDGNGETDICTFSTAVFWAIMKVLMLIAIGAAITACVGDFLAWAVVCIMTFTFIDPNLGAAAVLFAGVCLAVFVCAGLLIMAYRRFNRSTVVGGIVESIQEKTCFKIRFTD